MFKQIKLLQYKLKQTLKKLNKLEQEHLLYINIKFNLINLQSRVNKVEKQLYKKDKKLKTIIRLIEKLSNIKTNIDYFIKQRKLLINLL